MTRRILQGALFKSALCVFSAVQLLASPALRADGCSSTRFDLVTTVTHVHDGDTVFLADGSKLRLIGINTPETARDNRPAEPLADTAREALERLLATTGQQAGVLFDSERHDRHGRLLGHLFSPGGDNLTFRLLEQGMGFHVTVPPNLGFLGCYAAAEAHARENASGIWALPHYRPVLNATPSSGSNNSFYHVQGRVESTGKGRRAVYLDLTGRITLRIDRRDLGYFSDFPPEQLEGRTVAARGWGYHHNDKLYIRLRHPASLRIINK